MVMHVVLVDDWELRGDGSGDAKQIQFKSLRNLLEVYEQYGFKASINAEVMQQLYHLRWAEKYPQLREIADQWESLLLDAVRRGHDVQLHVHSQWHGAEYVGSRWILPSPWAITELPQEIAQHILQECKAYLENLVRTVKPEYRCVSFRSGAWAIAPSDFMLSALVSLGIRFDISIAKGLKYNNKVVRLDYTEVEEGTYPFHPDMADARRLGSRQNPIICIPTFTFLPSRSALFKRDARRLRELVSRKFRHSQVQPANQSKQKSTKSDQARDDNIWTDDSFYAGIKRRIRRELAVADIAQRSFWEMKDGIVGLRKTLTPGTEVPVILENHTKDITDLDDIRRLCHWLKAQPDIQVKTLSEIGDGLAAGRYRVRAAA